MKTAIGDPTIASTFRPYPAAVRHAGLVFVSGVRPHARGRPAGFADLPREGQVKRQGFELADLYEGQVTAELVDGARQSRGRAAGGRVERR